MRKSALNMASSVALEVCGVMLLFSVVAYGFYFEEDGLAEAGWQPATATWYGSPDGYGSDGGACGYQSLVKELPWASKIAAGSPALFNGGKGCGACYQVKCTESGLCSQTPVTVVITDECPGGICSGAGKIHFDLSGTAFGDMASDPGTSANLRNKGVVNLLYQRVPCSYPGMNVAFHVNDGSSNYWFSILVEYEAGDGDLGAVFLKQANSNTWQPMQQLWGAYWALTTGPLQAPFSIGLKSLTTGSTLTAENVIPQNWAASTTYTSSVNFS